MVDVTDQSANQPRLTSTVRNSSAAIAVLLLALTPQIFELAWSLGAFIFRFAAGRNPAQALIDHVFALAWAIPSLAGSFGTNGKAALSSDILLALIYSYPLIAVAVLTLFVRFRAPQDYFGGIVLVAIGLFALWASSDLQGMHGFSFGAGTAPRMFAVLLVGAGFCRRRLVGLGMGDGARIWRPMPGAARCSSRFPLFPSRSPFARWGW